ncbi:MAG: glutamate-1-semialdehyde 2,1-aminomutase [Nitrospinota bacterium]|jgi:glutamate-1-semialdehyde 2,1-aminomutase|nr:glutamate-1-semialdehyde 2,1-aminomutase [Nitrospinota bacterium]HJM44086.1 glutamate-1-semialdehyde 2,1-aminomutase [Nitrospinota bacterium]
MSGRSVDLFEESLGWFPGGVNSPVRAFRAVGGTPRFVNRGKGSRIWDEDGREYVDYLASWGPLILGHAHPDVVKAVCDAAADGTSFGAPTERESRLARWVVEAFPSIELLRMVNSGTEAGMSVLRAARGFTGRDVIVKFEGCYHGHSDGLLVKAGSGALTFGVPDSAGVPAAYAGLTLTLPFNDASAVEASFAERGGEIAAVIVEPIAANCGVIPPAPGFLECLRRETEAAGALLIFDEVITGFRVAWGGAQALYGIRPDLTCLGKILGGGLPVGAYGGRRDVMECVAPLGPVYQAGTLAGNPIAMAAGVATLEALRVPGVYEALEEMSARLEGELREAAAEAGVPVTMNRVGSLFCLFFTEGPVEDFASARQTDAGRYARHFHAMLDEGVNLAPSPFEAGFVSLAHTGEDVAVTGAAARRACRAV